MVELFFDSVDKVGKEQKVFWRISTNAAFGENDKISVVLASMIKGFDDAGRVADNIANDRIKLC